MNRYWVIGGEYEDMARRRLVPGTERLAGPFESERKARDAWLRLTRAPGTRPATTHFTIVTEGARA
jgi:hypothetical protein